MTIKDIGEIVEGLDSEVIEGCVRLYDKDGYPILELYGRRDEFGNLLDGTDDLEAIAKELRILWNKQVKEG